MKNTKIILWVAATFFVSAMAQAAPEGAALSLTVQEAEQQGDLPEPVLELMVLDGTELEKATEVTVATSSSGTYAQGFTYHAICMSTSDEQAERVHDIAIDAAPNKYKLGVVSEARYSLAQFKANGCAADERTRTGLIAEEESEIDDGRVVTLEPSETIVSGTVAGGASQSL